MNGMPRKQMVRYRTVPETASAGVDMTAVMRCTSKSKTTVSRAEIPPKSVTVLPTARAALFSSPAPTACAMVTLVPMARPTSITVSMCMTCEPMETAVVAATGSNWPTMKRSAMP